jgi:hypothetical protein
LYGSSRYVPHSELTLPPPPSTMEHLFSPCTRLHDITENQDTRNALDLFMEESNLNVSTEELLSAERGFTFADLCAMLGNVYVDTVAWLTPHTAVGRGGGIGMALHAWNQLDESCIFYFSVDGKEIFAMALSPEHLLEICDIVLRLLAVSVVHSIRLINSGSSDSYINAPTLANLMEQCQSLKSLSLQNLKMDEDLCRVLGGYSRPGLEIVLDCCKITSAGASALAEGLGRNQGPTKLHLCEIDNFVLANGLRENRSLKSLRPRFSSDLEVRDREFLAIAGALRESKGLVELDLAYQGFRVIDEAWGAICDSLETHPTLEVLDLRGTFMNAVPAVLKSRIQAILDMMKVNLSIRTIPLPTRYIEHELFRSVVPYLETNRFRPRLLAIQKTSPITYRVKVLGRALLSARTDANRFWMLLSGNADVAFPSRIAATAAANLPTHAAATSTSTTDVPAFAGPVTTAATAGLPTAAAAAPTIAAAANVATPSSGQKRKARP